MKIKLALLLISISTLIACQKDTESLGELFINLNGTWLLNHIDSGGHIPGNSIPIPKVEWEIKGNQLTVITPFQSEVLDLNAGKYQLSIAGNENELQYLLVDEMPLGAIYLNNNQFTIDTKNKPDYAISHAPSYTFVKEN